MWIHLAIFLVSLVVLVKSADTLVEYSARLAKRFQVSDLIVGLVITSVGTSLPELASSISATLAGSSGLVIGNVVGSNIANVGLVLGVAAMVRPFATEPRMHDRDGFIVMASVLVFFALALDNRIERLDAVLLLGLYAAYVVFAARSDRQGQEHRFRDFLGFMLDFDYVAPAARRLLRRGSRPETAETPAPVPARDQEKGKLVLEIGVVVASLVALILSARYLIAEAVFLAQRFEIPENLIGLSMVAVGTSLPELLVSVAAARKGKVEMIVGNVMGSNIANTLLIVGVAGALHPLEVSELSVVYTIPIMLFFSLALLYFVRTDWRVGRGQGFLAVAGYVMFLTAAFLQGWE